MLVSSLLAECWPHVAFLFILMPLAYLYLGNFLTQNIIS